MAKNGKTPSEVVAKLQEGEAIDLQALAMRHTEKAIGTLVRAQSAKKAPWSAKINAANSIIEHAHGRPRTQEGERAGTGGITVVIQQLSTGENRETYLTAKTIQASEKEVVTLEPVSGSITIDTDQIAAETQEG